MKHIFSYFPMYIFNIFYPCLMIHRVSPTSWFWLRPIVSLFLLPKVQFVVVVVFGWLVVLPVCLPCHFSLAFLLSTYWISSLAYVIMFSPVLLFWFLSYALTKTWSTVIYENHSKGYQWANFYKIYSRYANCLVLQ